MGFSGFVGRLKRPRRSFVGVLVVCMRFKGFLGVFSGRSFRGF